jgi:hypothetical protein
MSDEPMGKVELNLHEMEIIEALLLRAEDDPDLAPVGAYPDEIRLLASQWSEATRMLEEAIWKVRHD